MLIRSKKNILLCSKMSEWYLLVDCFKDLISELKKTIFITGFTPLHLSVLKGSKEMVEMLLTAGVDINARVRSIFCL